MSDLHWNVTFLFTDIEGSTQLLRQLGVAFAEPPGSGVRMGGEGKRQGFGARPATLVSRAVEPTAP
jgi:hypothetical protein